MFDTWIFDLDNTLYPPEARLFDQIERRMAAFIARELSVTEAAAHDLRARYWAEHGTTLAGLMSDHDVDPQDFLADVHDIDFTSLSPHPGLRDAIAALPGRKIVFTNGDVPYAQNVLAAIGLSESFDALYGIEHAQYVPKPAAEAYASVFGLDGLAPERSVMFEDSQRNLRVPHALGMTTVYVGPGDAEGAHVHHTTADLVGFLSQIGLAALPQRGGGIDWGHA
ncbi:MAG: pyrimidine 5'-nucleotidase [Pseudomonadota bacterium]